MPLLSFLMKNLQGQQSRRLGFVLYHWILIQCKVQLFVLHNGLKPVVIICIRGYAS